MKDVRNIYLKPAENVKNRLLKFCTILNSLTEPAIERMF